MKNLKNLCLFILLFFCGLNVVFSQNTQPTPYQKKQLELSKKWFQYLTGYSMSMSDEVFYEQLTAGKEANDFVLGLAILNYAMTYSKSDCKAVFAQMNYEFKQSEKLKNATDFRLEKERKLRAEQEIYERTDAGSIQKNIKIDFEKWNQKGEFEKEADYAARLQTQSKIVFDDICIAQIKNKTSGFSTDYLEKELSTYNSESEFFKVTFKINGLEWQNKINIPISQAPNFRDNWYDFRAEFNCYNWCFIGNKLCPTLITLYNGDIKYEFLLSLNNQAAITYSFDNFEIANSYLKGYVFNYSNALIINQQIYTDYCHRLDSIFKDFNRQLLQNPYNVDGKIMTTYAKMESEGNKEDNFNLCLENIKSNFEKMNNNFENELENSNVAKYCSIYYSLNPDKKADADKMYLECKCNYAERANFDIKFIKGNLQDCNCRAQEFKKYETLFTSKIEFDSFYDKGDDILQKEIEIRILKKEEETAITDIISNASKIESLDFKNIKLKATSNDLQSSYYYKINNYKNKPYYSKVIDSLLGINKGLRNEWTKTGKLFSNKVEFYEAYTSGEYKKILKEKKK